MKQNGISPEIYKAITSIVDERMELLAIGREEFNKLKAIVSEIAESQKKSEERLTRIEINLETLSERVAELTEAQKKSEERLTRLETSVAELTEAQKKSEQRVSELTEAQKKSEERLTRLETSVTELTEAQKKTEKELGALIISHKDLKKQVGGISHTIGFHLEDRAIKSLPSILKERYGIEIEVMDRRYISIDDKKREINIYGVGKKDGEAVYIFGESKTEPSRKEIKNFDKFIKRAEEKFGKIYPLFVYYTITEENKEFALKKDFLLIPSYILQL